MRTTLAEMIKSITKKGCHVEFRPSEAFEEGTTVTVRKYTFKGDDSSVQICRRVCKDGEYLVTSLEQAFNELVEYEARD